MSASDIAIVIRSYLQDAPRETSELVLDDLIARVLKTHGLDYVLNTIVRQNSIYPATGYRAIYASARTALTELGALPEDVAKTRCDELRRALRDLLDD